MLMTTKLLLALAALLGNPAPSPTGMMPMAEDLCSRDGACENTPLPPNSPPPPKPIKPRPY
jgi:hypothetical protein